MTPSRTVGIVIVSLITISAKALTQTREARLVSRMPGKPVIDLLRPNEDTVILEDTATPPLEVLPPAGVSMIEWKSRIATAIVLVHVDGIESSLTPSEDWIDSTAKGSIIEVLKRPVWWDEASGQNFSFSWDGGDVLVGGTHVIAVVPGTTPLKAGKRYLLFFSGDPSLKILRTGPSAAYEWVDSLGFRRLAVPPPGQLDPEPLAPEDLLVRVRAAAMR